MDQELKESCARIFAVLDVAGRGYISRDQVAIAVRLLHYDPTDDEIQEMLNKYGYKEYTCEELVAFINEELPAKSSQERKEDLRMAFTVFDKHNAGWIDKDIFVEILTKYGQMELDERETRQWVEENMNPRKDGKIRISEIEELFVSDDDMLTAYSEQKWDRV